MNNIDELKRNAFNELKRLIQDTEEQSEWPFSFTDEEVEKFGQGEPDGETWSYIVQARIARERLKSLKCIEAYMRIHNER